MEVHGRQPDDLRSAHERYRRGQERLTESSREKVRRAREILEGLPEVRQEALREAREANAEAAASVRGDGSPGSAGSIDEGRTVGGDVLELSGTAQHPTEALDLEREKRVEALRDAFLEGSLNTPERIENAATRILGG